MCIDGSSNQFGAKVLYSFRCILLFWILTTKLLQNTNVIEIYSQLVKSGEQLTYYNSGIGTYAKPSWTWSYLKQALDNSIDLAIAW